MEIDRNGLEVLGRDECVRLLATRTIDRIGISSEALPMILPVNYVVADGQVLLRTGMGTKLEAAVRRTVVAFEVDEIDEDRGTGWSVVVTGVTDARAPTEVDGEALACLERWVPGPDGRVVAVSLERISGRRLVPRAGSG